MHPAARVGAAIACVAAAGEALAGEADAPALYREHCAACHGAGRLGGTGPALLPESLGRVKREDARTVIAQGRPATQMQGFADRLDEAAIAALVDLVYAPLAEPPRWGPQEIAASRSVLVAAEALAERPRHRADPLNLFVVVESGDHHVTVLDGDRFAPITRFASRFALHGGPKFSPDGRFVTLASRDGWISKYDLWGLEMVAEVRAGINTRNIAISHDGRILAVANTLPHTLVFLDAETLALLRVVAVSALDKTSSRVSAVYQAAPRESFVVALKDIAELWEVSYAEDPPLAYGGLVHSYEKGMEEASEPGPLPIRRVILSEPLDDFFFDPSYRLLIGSARSGDRAVVVHLDVRREIAELPLPGLPHLGSGITWLREGRRVMATPHLGEGRISVIDLETWQPIKTIETLGPGFFLRSHENSAFAWADVFFGPDRDAVHVIDKRTLEIVRTLRPAPGKTAAHVEFTRDGAYALVSIWEMDGAVVVYDAVTLEEVTRIPLVKPSGKYNVFNKITRSEGTSH
jgi:mono/diheme cytochrome c family protein/DNA-binding beta-propeller fold protein YncE